MLNFSLKIGVGMLINVMLLKKNVELYEVVKSQKRCTHKDLAVA